MKYLVFAITGANGQIGAFLVETLRAQGHVVYELVREAEKAKDKTYYQFFDLTKPEKMPSLKAVDVLIHTACFFDTTDKTYELINVTGTQALFKQAKNDQVKYAIFISTLSAYPEARSLYGRVKYHLEQWLLKEHQNTVVIRPGLVFHTPLQGITAAMDRFVRNYPIVPLIGSGKQWLYPCLLEDLTELIINLSMHQPCIKKPMIAASDQVITFKQLVQYLAEQQQKKVRLCSVPFFVIYLSLKMVELCGLSIGLRSDSLLGLQYANKHLEFTQTKKQGIHFRGLGD